MKKLFIIVYKNYFEIKDETEKIKFGIPNDLGKDKEANLNRMLQLLGFEIEFIKQSK